jgi:hypothetical protein
MNARRLILGPLVVLCALTALSVVAVAPALAARGHVFEKAFGRAGSGNGEFSEPQGVAVNESTGDVYVVDRGNSRVEWFSSTGVYEGQFDGSGTFEVKGTVESGTAAGFGGKPGEVETGQFSPPGGIAVDNDPSSPSFGDVYVVDVGHSVIDKFSVTGHYEGQLTGTCASAGMCPGSVISFSQISGVAVDSNGVVWVEQGPLFPVSETIDGFSDAVTNEFASSRASGARLGFPQPEFAVDSEGNFYVNESFGFVKLNSSGEELSGYALENIIDTEPLTGVAVELATNDLYVDNVTNVARFTSEGDLLERFGAGQLKEGTGVGVNSAAEAVYVADAATNTVEIYEPAPPASPTIESESISDVAADSATFDAGINPRGPSTEYRFEYGQCVSSAVSSCASSPYEASVPVPDGQIGSGFSIAEVTAHVQHLKAHTTYHVRVVAQNELGEESAEANVTTQTEPAGGQLVLPDDRQWEMVTPPQKEGADFDPIGETGVIQASADGDAIADLAATPTEANPAGNALTVNVLSTRDASGWSSQTIALPHTEATGLAVGNGYEHRFFSEDLSLGVVQPFGGFLALSPEASESTAYLHTDYLDGEVSDHCESSYQSASSCYKPLVDAANVPTGTRFGEIEDGKCRIFRCGPQFVGASPDAKHVVLSSAAQLTETSTEGKDALYEWNAGSLALVSILPKGEVNEAGGSMAEEATLGQGERTARSAISNDGSRIIWEGRTSSTGTFHLYLRDMVRGETVRLDLPESGSGTGSSAPVYMIASTDGSRIFFTDKAGLTAESSSGGSDLYEYDLNAPAGNRLRDLSVDTHAGEAAEVTNVIGASEEGSYVYFTAAGALVQGAVPGECGGGQPSSGDKSVCNLYVSHDGMTTLVAALSQEDFPDWMGNGIDLGHLTARVSPDGEWLTFMSQRSLTGYDTSDAVSGRPDEEVYLYHAEAQREGRPSLVCASCNPTGARPVGVAYEKINDALAGGDRVWNGATGIAANIPGWTLFSLGQSRYQSRYLSDSGRLFFNSSDALVAQDVDGTEDVYEYEPSGTGSCTQSVETFSERSGGCVGLISSGSSPEESAFLDASETGGDVFFLTKAKLVSEDFDTSLDVYDARECTAQASCFAASPVALAACETGEACKPAPTPQPPIFGAPASGTFSGSGNVVVQSGVKVAVASKSLTRARKLARALSACGKKKHPKQRAVCERKARSKYGAGKSVKANAKRGVR